MRSLVILRGAPGSGKSTWIKQNNLEQYTLCPDDIRILCSSIELHADGSSAITRNRDTEGQTWKTLFELLEYRMSKGEFTVIDATASKTRDIQQYKNLADKYRYRMYCVDFTQVPLETCLEQNKLRPKYKWVPEEAIKNIYARFATQKVPGGVTVIKPEEFNKILEKPIDLSEYRKIVFIGDIHGCYDTLMQYFKDGIDPDICYIFCGDYIDRGNQNAEVLKYFSSIMNLPNVCLLEGNHEKWLRDYGEGIPAKSHIFEKKTRPQLEQAEYTSKQARMFYRKLRQFSHFTYNGLEILACHGGIPHLKQNLLYIPSNAFISGVGDYKDYQTITETWMRDTASNQYLVHGHRNTEEDPVQIADRVFNLEGRVEFGGQIRIVELDKALAWKVIELEDCQPITADLKTETRPVETVEEAVTYLRNNKCVQEKVLDDGISSFNFTREAFYKGNWNQQTILARGLFIDTDNNKIMARSYEKFFKIDEIRATELANLKNSLVFPVTAYVKENGFLGIVSYDYKKDDLFIASKSTNKGDYVGYLTNQLEPYRKAILAYLKNHQDVTLVFECIDPINDPHIIKYEDAGVVLLDVIYNKLQFDKIRDYKHLENIARQIEVPVKEKALEFKSYEDLKEFYEKVQDIEYKWNDQYHIEGFVFEDALGFMTKCKTGFYNFWKKMRGVADQTLRCGYITKTGGLLTAEENYFYGFCKELYVKDKNGETKSYPYNTDIISLREKYLTTKEI